MIVDITGKPANVKLLDPDITKIKAVLIKDFHNENGTLHRTEKVTIEHEKDGQARVLNAMGQIFVVPRHILKEIP